MRKNILISFTVLLFLVGCNEDKGNSNNIGSSNNVNPEVKEKQEGFFTDNFKKLDKYYQLMLKMKNSKENLSSNEKNKIFNDIQNITKAIAKQSYKVAYEAVSKNFKIKDDSFKNLKNEYLKLAKQIVKNKCNYFVYQSDEYEDEITSQAFKKPNFEQDFTKKMQDKGLSTDCKDYFEQQVVIAKLAEKITPYYDKFEKEISIMSDSARKDLIDKLYKTKEFQTNLEIQTKYYIAYCISFNDTKFKELSNNTERIKFVASEILRYSTLTL